MVLVVAVLVLAGVLIAFVALLNGGEERGSGEPSNEPPGEPAREQTEGGSSDSSDLGAPESQGSGTADQDEPADENRPVSEGEPGADGDGSSDGSEGGSSEPPDEPSESPDPLGLENASGEGPEAALENTGIRSVATKFVSAAYGYTGSDGEQYASQVHGLTEPASFPESPGGRLIERNRERLAGGESLESAARLESMSYVGEVAFEEISPPLDYQDQGAAHEVDVRYVMGERWAYNDEGEPVLEGERTTYSQRVIFLEKLDPYDPEGEDRLSPGWRVVSATLPEEA